LGNRDVNNLSSVMAEDDQDIEKLELQAKTRWRVSAMAMAYRLNSLGLLSDWQYKCLLAGNCVQTRGEVFLKSSIAPSAWHDGAGEPRVCDSP
jgi:Zn-dependent peptidase ImmA (M78 family)